MHCRTYRNLHKIGKEIDAVLSDLDTPSLDAEERDDLQKELSDLRSEYSLTKGEPYNEVA